MNEVEKSWLAGVMDSRGVISVSRSNNVMGNVTLNFSDEKIKDIAVGLLREEDIECNPASVVGKTYKLHFTSVRGTQLLKILLPWMQSERLLRRAKLYCDIFPLESDGKHMKIIRMEGYAKWLKFEKRELERTT